MYLDFTPEQNELRAEIRAVAEKLWRGSGLKPTDIQTAFLYAFVFTQLEELGFS